MATWRCSNVLGRAQLDERLTGESSGTRGWWSLNCGEEVFSARHDNPLRTGMTTLSASLWLMLLALSLVTVASKAGTVTGSCAT